MDILSGSMPLDALVVRLLPFAYVRPAVGSSAVKRPLRRNTTSGAMTDTLAGS